MALRIHGLAVHFRFGVRGYPEPADDTELLADSIETILKTAVGERVHRPTFGSHLKRIVFADMGRAAAVRARVEARRAIEQWEKRVIVDAVNFRTEDSTIFLDVVWRPRNNMADARQTQIPFGDGGLR